MRTNNKSSLLSAIVSLAVCALLSTPVQAAQSTEVVRATYKLSASTSGSSAMFTKTRGSEKITQIGSTKMQVVLTELSQQASPPATQIEYLLLGDPMRPDGGLFARFPGLTIPNLGISFDEPKTDLTLFFSQIIKLIASSTTVSLISQGIRYFRCQIPILYQEFSICI